MDERKLKIAVFMWYDDNIKKYGDLTYMINQKYCQKYDYNIIMSNTRKYDNRTAHWERLPLILEHIDNYDYCIWIDADAFFYIDSPPITNVIREHSDKLFILSADMDNKQLNQENCILNSGFFIVKNSAVSKIILNEWAYSEELYNNRYGYIVRNTKHLFHDQGVLRLMYDKNYMNLREISTVIDYGILQLYPREKYNFTADCPSIYKKTDGSLHIPNEYGLDKMSFICHCALLNKEQVFETVNNYYSNIFKKYLEEQEENKTELPNEYIDIYEEYIEQPEYMKQTNEYIRKEQPEYMRYRNEYIRKETINRNEHSNEYITKQEENKTLPSVKTKENKQLNEIKEEIKKQQAYMEQHELHMKQYEIYMCQHESHIKQHENHMRHHENHMKQHENFVKQHENHMKQYEEYKKQIHENTKQTVYCKMNKKVLMLLAYK
jgi:hypothetical protein